jgi:outer membrane biosynthesis protein TonB
MTTKKTAKKPPESTRPETAKAADPVAKKAVKTVKSATAKKTSAKQAAPKAAARPSPDVIARAAYLNYRRRVEQGLPGDSHGDWLEAERYFSITRES